MKISFEENLLIAEKFCTNPKGCPKWKGAVDYDERMKICAGCVNTLNKYDMVQVINYYKNLSEQNTDNITPAISKQKAPPKGKSTELNKYQIRKILLMTAEGMSKNQIAGELKISFRTVKNVIELGFKNEMANEKVIQVKNEMINDGLL